MSSLPPPGGSLANLREFLGDVKRLGPAFGKHLRISSVKIAKHVVSKSKQKASTRQEVAVAKGLFAKSDRVPTIQVSSSRGYVSKSRPARGRSKPTKIIDVWFGAEFGGGKYGAGNPTSRDGYTTQFRPHLGTTGYFFYPTVRQEGQYINKEYEGAVNRSLRESRVERLAPTSLKMFFGGR